MLNDARRHWICFLFESEEAVNQACGGGAKERPHPTIEAKTMAKRQLRY